MQSYETVDQYISQFSGEVKQRLEALRSTIQQSSPGSTEKISYQIPAFVLNGTNLIYFAGWKHHTSIYPIQGADKEFASELAGYKMSKGTIQFPHDKPLPLELIRKIVEFKVEQNQAKYGKKK